MRGMLNYDEISAHFRTLAVSATMMADAFESLAKDFSQFFDDGVLPWKPFIHERPGHDPKIREHLKASYELEPEDFLKFMTWEDVHNRPEPEEKMDIFDQLKKDDHTPLRNYTEPEKLTWEDVAAIKNEESKEEEDD